MKKRYIFYLLLVLGFAYLVYYRIQQNKKLAAGAGISGKNGRKKGDKAGGVVTVESVVLKSQEFDDEIEVTGTLDASESIQLQSEVPGLITGIYFKEGANVTKGSRLVQINDRDIQAQLLDVKTKEKLAASNENRAKQLLEKGAISQEEYDTTLAALHSFRAQMQLIQSQLAKTTIKAPFSGKVGLRNVSIGGYLTTGTVIANLVSVDPLRITFSVPEKYTSRIKINSMVKFQTDVTKKNYEAKIFAIEPGINTSTRTLQIRALVPNPSGVLLPGSFAKIKIPLQNVPGALIVPTESMVPVEGGQTVFIKKSGKAKKTPIETGVRTDAGILVTKGLAVGDTVLTTGLMSVKDGNPVKVIPRTEKNTKL